MRTMIKGHRGILTWVKNLFKKDNFGIIDYEGSPTGKAFIGLAKQPLMPNANGIGFQGVLLQNDTKTLVQCSECGGWFTQINHRHLEKHNLSVIDYRKKYKLNYTTGLISDSYARVKANLLNSRAERMINLTPSKIKSKEDILSERADMSKATKRIYGSSIEFKNKRGTCPEQLKHNLMLYINKHQALPDSKSGYSQIGTLRKRFGTLNSAFNTYGLPTRISNTSKYTYTFSDGEVYSLNKENNYIYDLMLKKCPELSKYK